MISDPTIAQALPDAWMRAIDESARTLLGPHDRVGDALATEVARLSELYTRDRGALRTQSAALAARLRFFLPRDLPKIEGPLAELAWAGKLPAGPRWRVLDLGAGYGTTTLGISTYARRVGGIEGVAGIEGLDVIAAERDPRSLDAMRHLARRAGQGDLADVSVPIALDARELDVEHIDVRAFGGRFQLVVLGLALNELWIDRPDKLDRRAALLARCAEILTDDGAILVVEPALRESTRELMALRDRLVELGKVHLFAPCTHTLPCPMLARERDWCHEDLPLALPESLRAIARGAGLRFEGLSYAYLTLRRAPGTIADGAYRIVGGPIESKGRTEWHGSGEGRLVRISRLDRHRTEGDPLEGARRGSIVGLEPGAPDAVRSDRTPIVRRR